MAMLVILGGSMAILFLYALALGLWSERTGQQIIGGSLRSDEAEAQIEAEDIDQMIEARNAIRRRRGLPEVGDQLAEEVLRGHRSGG